MIAFLHDHPLIRLPDRSLLCFERRWLVESLQLAAEKAGESSWWPATHIAESVSAFLREDFHDTSIDLCDLEALVKSSLVRTGFHSIADELHFAAPPARLSLAELARLAGHGYELRFFHLLSSRLREALAAGCHRIECADLLHCVKILRCARRWRTDCRRLKSEIVAFIRQQAELAGAPNLRIELI